MLPTIVAWIAFATVSPAWGEDVVHDFRSSRFDYKRFRFEGPNADQFIKPEAEGLRWRFHSGNAPDRPVGVYWNSRIKGDFGIQVDYELLKAEKPKSGNGVGAELYLTLDGPTKDAVSLACVTSPDGSPMLRFLHLTTDEDGQRKATESQTGRLADDAHRRQMKLQLKRQGTKLTASFASKGAEHDVSGVLHECDIPETDVLMSRFAGLTGKDKAAVLDMRLLEFVVGEPKSPRMDIASQPIGDIPVRAVPPASVSKLPRPWNRWIVAATATGLCFAIGVIALRQWKQRDESGPASPVNAATRAVTTSSAETSSPRLNFVCSSCGAKLKADAEQRGLRIRCPRCHEQVLVLE